MISTWPSSAIAAEAIFRAASSCMMSCVTGIMTPPAALTSCARVSSSSRRRATPTTRTPSSASPFAIARPIPVDAPLTTAVLDLRSRSMSALLSVNAYQVRFGEPGRQVYYPCRRSKEEEKTMVWNPQQYLKFSGHRLRPAVDLLMRIPDFEVGSIADLGAGAGNVTKLIKERWPDAAVVGVEGSAEMVAAGKKAAPEVEWLQQDLATWQPARTYDLIYSNAALHWLPDHARLFPALVERVASGGILA